MGLILYWSSTGCPLAVTFPVRCLTWHVPTLTERSRSDPRKPAKSGKSEPVRTCKPVADGKNLTTAGNRHDGEGPLVGAVMARVNGGPLTQQAASRIETEDWASAFELALAGFISDYLSVVPSDCEMAQSAQRSEQALRSSAYGRLRAREQGPKLRLVR